MLSNYKSKCTDDELRFLTFGLNAENTDSFYNSDPEAHLNCEPVVETHASSEIGHNQDISVFLILL
jgi:hypothetical protein